MSGDWLAVYRVRHDPCVGPVFEVYRWALGAWQESRSAMRDCCGAGEPVIPVPEGTVLSLIAGRAGERVLTAADREWLLARLSAGTKK